MSATWSARGMERFDRFEVIVSAKAVRTAGAGHDDRHAARAQTPHGLEDDRMVLVMRELIGEEEEFFGQRVRARDAHRIALPPFIARHAAEMEDARFVAEAGQIGLEIAQAVVAGEDDEPRRLAVARVVVLVPRSKLGAEKLRHAPRLKVGHPEDEWNARIGDRCDRKKNIDARIEEDVARVGPSMQRAARSAQQAAGARRREPQHLASVEQCPHFRERIIVLPDIHECDVLLGRQRRHRAHEMLQVVPAANPLFLRIDAHEPDAQHRP